MTLDATITTEENKENYSIFMPLVQLCKLNIHSIQNIKKLMDIGEGNLTACTNSCILEMDNETSLLIKQAEQVLIEAKSEMKKKFPVRSKLNYLIFLLKNPFKTLLGKTWLLLSK